MTIRRRLAEQWDSRDILSSLWRLSACPWVTVASLLALGLLVCAVNLLPQIPSEIAFDSVAASVWISSLRARYGLLADWMVGLRLTDLIHSPWLRVLLGVLGFNLLLLAADLLNRLGARKDSENGPVFQDGLWGSLLVFCGLLLVLFGCAFQERLSWRDNNVSLRPGQVRPVGHGSGLALRADSIKSHYDPRTGLVRGGQTELTFLNADGVAGNEVLFDQTPSFFGGLVFHQSSTEPVLLIRGMDAGGHRLALQTPETGASELSEVTLRFRDEEAARYIVVLRVPGQSSALQFQQKGNQGYVLVPERDLSLRISFALPPQGEVDPLFQVEAFRGADTTAFQQVLITSTESVEINGDLYTFQPQRYAIIQVGRDYSPVLYLLGGALVLVGLLLYLWQIVRQRTARQVAGKTALILAFTVAMWVITRNWSIAQTSSSPASLPLWWWRTQYWVFVLTCASLAMSAVEGIAGWIKEIGESEADHPPATSCAMLLGLSLLVLLLLLCSVSSWYTRGVIWEWTQTESLRLIAWSFFMAVWCLRALLMWRGRRFDILAITGIVPMVLCLLLPGR